MPIQKIPAEGYTWFTPEIAEKLNALTGPHLTKKRTTIIKLAFARANEQPWRQIFQQPDTCSEVIWYTKWQHDPAIRDAYETCYRQALDWNDAETARLEEHYRQQRRQSIARWAASAPDALSAVMLDPGQKGADRISAANALITWADPEAAGQASPPAPAGSADQTMMNIGLLSNLSEEDLDGIIANLEAAQSSPAPGQAAPPGPDSESKPT